MTVWAMWFPFFAIVSITWLLACKPYFFFYPSILVNFLRIEGDAISACRSKICESTKSDLFSWAESIYVLLISSILCWCCFSFA